ncbi:unnamed protein product [Choristocarpus tenellus]
MAIGNASKYKLINALCVSIIANILVEQQLGDFYIAQGLLFGVGVGGRFAVSAIVTCVVRGVDTFEYFLICLRHSCQRLYLPRPWQANYRIKRS